MIKREEFGPWTEAAEKALARGIPGPNDPGVQAHLARVNAVAAKVVEESWTPKGGRR